MANKLFWKLIILAGFLPFIIAILNGASAATLEYTADFDFSLFFGQLLSYSAEHWLTYVMGILLMLISLKHLKYD